MSPLGLPRGAANPVLNNPAVSGPPPAWALLAADRAAVAAAAGPQPAAIPGTGSPAHLLENLAAEHVALDDEAPRELATG